MNDKLLWTSSTINSTDATIEDIEISIDELYNILKENHESDFLIIETSRSDWRGQKGIKYLNLDQPKQEAIKDLLTFDYDFNFNLYRNSKTNKLYGSYSSHDVISALWRFENCLDPEPLTDFFNEMVIFSEKFENNDYEEIITLLNNEYNINKGNILFKTNSTQLGEAYILFNKKTKNKIIEIIELANNTLTYKFDIRELSRIVFQ